MSPCHDAARRPLMQRQCPECQRAFLLCGDCWRRGYRYCSPRCRLAGRTRIHRCANAQYQRTPQGRRNHAHRQHEYRHRKRAHSSAAASSKIVTDHSSAPSDSASSCGHDARVPPSPDPVGAPATPARHSPGRIRTALPWRCWICRRPGLPPLPWRLGPELFRRWFGRPPRSCP